MLAAASANIAFNCDLVNSSGCLTPGLRVDTILSTGRAQAANSAGFRFGTDTILGLAVGGLWPRFKPMRSNLAHTALRLCPSRVAICAALWPLAQSFLRSATLAASHMEHHLTPNGGKIATQVLKRIRRVGYFAFAASEANECAIP